MGHVTIRNRFLSTSHAPGYAVHGDITDRYIAYETEKAKGGVGLVQFGGATAVSIENSFHYGQINGAVDRVIPQYQRMAQASMPMARSALSSSRMAAGASVGTMSIGCRPSRRPVCANWCIGRSPPSWRIMISGALFATMPRQRFGRSEGNLDGVEISTQAGTLIEQFWSPAMNQRSDDYGGSLANRMRFGLEVLEACRKAVGDAFLIGIRMPGDEMLEGGLTHEDCIEIARHYARSGLINFISIVGGTAVDYKATAKSGRRCGCPRRLI